MKNPFMLCISILLFIGSHPTYSLKTITMDDSRTSIQVDNPIWGSSSSGILKSHSIFSYQTNRNKTITFYTVGSKGIQASIRILDLRPNCQDKLTLFDSSNPYINQMYCNKWSIKSREEDKRELKTFYASSGNLGVRFDTKPGTSFGYDGFQLTYTAASSPPCGSFEFRCYNGRCIADVLKCDGHNHCGDNSDQNYCGRPWKPSTNTGKIVGIVFGVIFLIIALVCLIYIRIKRSMSRREEGIVITHPPPGATTYPPSYPPSQPGSYPPPPPPYSQYPQGQINPGYR